MLELERITHVAFDADDTLWAHEDIFVNAKATATEILAPYLAGRDLEAELYRFEKKNLPEFGYGVKGFVLSLIETAIELSDGRIGARDIQRFIELGKEMIAHPIELLPYVRATIDVLEDRYPLLIITKGDLFDQENKVARAGIGEHFAAVEILSEKSPERYRAVCRRHDFTPSGLLMIGNSLRSDILPVLEIGGQAIHVPYHLTWGHEAASAPIARPGLAIADNLREATHLLFPTGVPSPFTSRGA